MLDWTDSKAEGVQAEDHIKLSSKFSMDMKMAVLLIGELNIFMVSFYDSF